MSESNTGYYIGTDGLVYHNGDLFTGDLPFKGNAFISGSVIVRKDGYVNGNVDFQGELLVTPNLWADIFSMKYLATGAAQALGTYTLARLAFSTFENYFSS